MSKSYIILVLTTIFYVACSSCSKDDDYTQPDLIYETPNEIVNNIDLLITGSPTLDENGSVIEKDELVIHSTSSSFANLNSTNKLIQLNSWGSQILSNEGIVTTDDLFTGFDACLCGDKLSRASLDESLTQALGGVSGVGRKLASQSGGVVEASPNFIVFNNEFENGVSGNERVDGFSNESPNEIVIAVLDTGIDAIADASFQEKMWTMDDQNQLCLDNYPGYDPTNINSLDLVDGDLNPYDEHSHGTHVAGTIFKEINKISDLTGNSINYRIMPVRTHNEDGLGTYFNALCGIYYATDMEADLINASWGFYGLDENDLMEKALRYAENNQTYVIAALGNSNLDISLHPHVPSNYTNYNNVIAVGSHYDSQISSFSNYYSNQSKTALAPGEEILSFMPRRFGGEMRKSGTSMATPHITAFFAYEMFQGKTFSEAKDLLLNTNSPQQYNGNNYIIYGTNQFY